MYVADASFAPPAPPRPSAHDVLFPFLVCSAVQELAYQKKRAQEPGDKFVSAVSQFITVASFGFSDVEDSLTEAKDLVRPGPPFDHPPALSLVWGWGEVTKSGRAPTDDTQKGKLRSPFLCPMRSTGSHTPHTRFPSLRLVDPLETRSATHNCGPPSETCLSLSHKSKQGTRYHLLFFGFFF